MFPTGRCRVAIGAAAAAANDGCLGINLTPRPGARSWSCSKRKMVRCARHGFDDVADEDDSGAPAQSTALVRQTTALVRQTTALVRQTTLLVRRATLLVRQTTSLVRH